MKLRDIEVGDRVVWHSMWFKMDILAYVVAKGDKWVDVQSMHPPSVNRFHEDELETFLVQKCPYMERT